MKCTRSLVWGSLLLFLYFISLGAVWTGLQTQWPQLGHPAGALFILVLAYVAMEKSVSYLAKKRSWSC